jgi:hypothetical protein
MSIEHKLDPSSRMINAHTIDPVSKREWMDLFLDIKNDPERIEGMDAIFDLTKHEVNISDHYIWIFAQRMMPQITKNYLVKWAFVSSKQVTIEKVDKFASYLMRNKNMTVRGFTDIDAARKWIQEDKHERFVKTST